MTFCWLWFRAFPYCPTHALTRSTNVALLSCQITCQWPLPHSNKRQFHMELKWRTWIPAPIRTRRNLSSPKRNHIWNRCPMDLLPGFIHSGVQQLQRQCFRFNDLRKGQWSSLEKNGRDDSRRLFVSFGKSPNLVHTSTHLEMRNKQTWTEKQKSKHNNQNKTNHVRKQKHALI